MEDDVNALRRTLAVRELQCELESGLVGFAEEICRAEFDTGVDRRGSSTNLETFANGCRR